MLKNMLGNYFQELSRVLIQTQVSDATGSSVSLDEGIERVVELVLGIYDTKKKIMLVGNGGSAAAASHQAVDFWKCSGVRAIAFNDFDQLTCLGNDFGYEYVFSKPIEMFADKSDLLMAISSSGKSKNILNAVDAAKSMSCQAITYSGFDENNPLRSLGDINFYIHSHSYGHVEVAHLALIHAVADIVGPLIKER